MIEHVGQRIKDITDNQGIKVIDLSRKTGKSTTAIYEIFKKKDVSSEILREFATILKVPVTAFLEEELAGSPAAGGISQNAGGNNNNQNAGIGKFSFTADDCPKQLEVLQEKYALLERLVAAKEEMIQVLRGR